MERGDEEAKVLKRAGTGLCLSVRWWPGPMNGIYLTVWDFHTVLHGNKSPSHSCTASGQKYVYLGYNSFQFSTHI